MRDAEKLKKIYLKRKLPVNATFNLKYWNQLIATSFVGHTNLHYIFRVAQRPPMGSWPIDEKSFPFSHGGREVRRPSSESRLKLLISLNHSAKGLCTSWRLFLITRLAYPTHPDLLRRPPFSCEEKGKRNNIEIK
jgi:hypothetical protein